MIFCEIFCSISLNCSFFALISQNIIIIYYHETSFNFRSATCCMVGHASSGYILARGSKYANQHRETTNAKHPCRGNILAGKP